MTKATTTTSPTKAGSPARVELPADWAPLVEGLRLAHVQQDGGGLDIDEIRLGAPRVDAADALVIDGHNGLVDVDARLSLAVIARALRARGWLLPLWRPLSAAPLWRLASRAPFVVDALVQRATMLNGDGDLLDTPPAPRHSAGPSLLHGATTTTPLAILVRARLRIVSAAHTTLWRERHDSVGAAAARMRDLVDGARAFAACAEGSTVCVLRGSSSPASASGSTTVVDQSELAVHRRSAWPDRWRSTRSLRPGDIMAIASALAAGQRVVSVPYLQRTAVLERARPPRMLLDVKNAAQALCAALSSAPANAPRPSARERR